MGTSYNPKIVTDGLVLNLDPANVKSYPANQDPFVNNVSLMLSMDGANNSTTFIDSSQNALAVTAVGNTKISTDQSKFGGASAYFDGTGDYLSFTGGMPSGAGTEFTIECWVRLDDLADYRVITRKVGGIDFYVAPDGSISVGRSGVVGIAASATGLIAAGTWYHIAVTRDTSNNYKIYVNGTQVASGTNSFSVTAATTIGFPAFSGPHYFKGYIDDFRVTNALRYTANFTPPTAPLPLPNRATDLTRSKFLVYYSSGTTFNSSKAGTMALNGTSAYGSGNNFLSVGPTSSFTVCTWVKYNSTVTSGPARCSAVAKAANTNDFEVVLGFPYTYSASKLGLEVGKAGIASQIAYSLNSNPTGVWYHLGGVFMNGSGNFYINGVYQSTVTYSATVNTASTNSNAWAFGTEPFNGSASGPFVNGNIGPTCIYNRILSNNEILQNYNATKGRFV